VLHLGELITQGPAEKVRQEPAVRELYLGSHAAADRTGEQ
jgi:ABC-type branched-subunit amino acid transport system ATPase component